MTDEDRIRGLIEKGAEMLGGTGAAAIGFLVGGPAGAFAGAATGPLLTGVLKGVISDVAKRVLSSREESRLGAAAFLSLNRIRARFEAGDEVINSTLFEANASSSAPAEELFEGVLLTCRSTFEERKLPFIANIFANAPFFNASPETIHFIIRLGDRLTYQELCVAALIGQKDELSFDTSLLETKMHMDREQLQGAKPRTELQKQKADIIRCLGAIGGNYPGMLGGGEKVQGTYGLSDFGDTVFQLMGLDEIPFEDLGPMIKLLRTTDAQFSTTSSRDSPR